MSSGDVLPVPVPNERVQTVYDRVAGAYARTVAPAEAPSKRRALSTLPLAAGDRVCSVGCGPGLSLPALVARVGKAGTVHALDAAPGMLAAARRHCRRQGVAERIAFTRGDARELPYPDDAFDAVVALDVLELFDGADLDAVCGELHRVLAPDGRCLVVTMDSADVPDSWFLRAYERAFASLPGFALVGCRPIDARGALTAAGFAVAATDLEWRGGVWPMRTFLARPSG